MCKKHGGEEGRGSTSSGSQKLFTDIEDVDDGGGGGEEKDSPIITIISRVCACAIQHIA